MKALLMGGQACILYGGAEFSRDIDIAVAVSPDNLGRLRAALSDLRAESVFFPPLSAEALRRGHACHFRCLGKGLHRVRLDVMSVMRGVGPFGGLWKRRERVRLPGVGAVSVMSLPDLVRAKKTQRGKDWPMIRRLIEADIIGAPSSVLARRVRFWLQECRTPELLETLMRLHRKMAMEVARQRAAVRAMLRGDRAGVKRELNLEERREREADRRYWAPLRAELEKWRLERHRGGG